VERRRVVASACGCALGAGALALGLWAFRGLSRLARIADRRDAIEILEHSTGGARELFAALGRADGLLWVRIVGAIALFIGLVRVVRRHRLRNVGIAFVVALGAIVCWQIVADRRHAMHTLCWAASSGVYDRSTRERALVRGRALLDTMLGRAIRRLDDRARLTCDDAGRTLGMSAQ
jgi:hypothetical protein